MGRGPFGFSRKTWPFIKVLVGNWIFSVVFYIAAKQFITWQPDAWDTIGDRLVVVINNSVFAILPALLGVAIVASQRLNPDMWVGRNVKPNSALDINTRFILNTAEQFTLFFIAQCGIAIHSPVEEAHSLVVLTFLFLLGRALFWIGYHRNPYLRAFGFGLTFYPTFGTFMWLVLLMVLGIRIPI